jgi:hypothetical protein
MSEGSLNKVSKNIRLRYTLHEGSETILFASKLMAKHTGLLTKNSAFEHKFHVDTRKWQK